MVRDLCENFPAPGGLPPAIVLGGEANALSVIRSLAALDVTVYALNEAGACARHSRWCRWVPIPVGPGSERAMADFLLGPQSDALRGAVLLARSDAGVQVLAHHREALLNRFRLDESNVPAQLDLLDKLATYRHATAAGLPTPRFWVADSSDEVLAIRDELVYPLIVKPRHAHRAGKRFNTKHTLATSFEEVRAACRAERDAAVDVLLMEWIPGGDDRLCSYFTYIDDNGEFQFDFTKRVVRRFPPGMGPGAYHITDWMPQLVAPARAMFRHIGLRGLANIEFKLDPRDGLYKIIECNARFNGSNALLASSGLDLAAFVYRRLVGLPQPPLTPCKSGLRLLDPIADALAFLELKKRGELTLGRWLASLLHRQTFPYFRWSDPMPAIVRFGKMLKLACGKFTGTSSPVADAAEPQTQLVASNLRSSTG